MAFNAPDGPFSLPDPLGDAWEDMVRRNRRLQAQNDPLFGPPEGPADGINTDEPSLDEDRLPLADWMARRSQQALENLSQGVNDNTVDPRATNSG